jgi:hypothetical protein
MNNIENPYESPRPPKPVEQLANTEAGSSAAKHRGPDWVDYCIAVGIAATTWGVMLQIAKVTASYFIVENSSMAQSGTSSFACVAFATLLAAGFACSYLQSK